MRKLMASLRYQTKTSTLNKWGESFQLKTPQDTLSILWGFYVREKVAVTGIYVIHA